MKQIVTMTRQGREVLIGCGGFTTLAGRTDESGRVLEYSAFNAEWKHWPWLLSFVKTGAQSEYRFH